VLGLDAVDGSHNQHRDVPNRGCCYEAAYVGLWHEADIASKSAIAMEPDLRDFASTAALSALQTTTMPSVKGRFGSCVCIQGPSEPGLECADKTLATLSQKAGLDPVPLLDAALSPETQAVYEANTEEAIRRSVFGSPTYFVHGDMFYGQDRLELVERTLKQPFAGTWPPPD
jgi:hypothetical protein